MYNKKVNLKEQFNLGRFVNKQIEVKYGYNNQEKQFEHVVLGAQLKMETFLNAEQCIYALCKSSKKPIKFTISHPTQDPTDLIKIYSSIGIQLGEAHSDLTCLIYQHTVIHPTITKDRNLIDFGSVPAIIVYAQDKNGKKRYFLRQFHVETKQDKLIPKGWVNNETFDEINKVGWFTDNKNVKKYLLFDLPLFVIWTSFNATIGKL